VPRLSQLRSVFFRAVAIASAIVLLGFWLWRIGSLFFVLLLVLVLEFFGVFFQWFAPV